MIRRLKDALPTSVSGTFFAVLLLTGVVSYGQVTGRNAINGIVTDSTGAVIVNAQVVVTNIATNVTHSSKHEQHRLFRNRQHQSGQI